MATDTSNYPLASGSNRVVARLRRSCHVCCRLAPSVNLAPRTMGMLPRRTEAITINN